MAGVPNSQEIFNAREELVSGDLMRAQTLISRDSQNTAAALSRSIDSNASNPTSAANLLAAVGTPISSLDLVPTIAAGSGFQMSVGAGSGYLYDASFTSLTADDSPYLIARWNAATVTHANPDGTNPRIDIIYAVPTSVATDIASRNILLDPIARTVAAQSVNKTSNPLTALSVVTGTAAASPVVPVLPAHAIPLFYVYIPAAAASAANFAPCRATWRRAPYPFAGMSGVVSGMGLA